MQGTNLHGKAFKTGSESDMENASKTELLSIPIAKTEKRGKNYFKNSHTVVNHTHDQKAGRNECNTDSGALSQTIITQTNWHVEANDDYLLCNKGIIIGSQ